MKHNENGNQKIMIEIPTDNLEKCTYTNELIYSDVIKQLQHLINTNSISYEVLKSLT
jgi:hypothetical protein